MNNQQINQQGKAGQKSGSQQEWQNKPQKSPAAGKNQKNAGMGSKDQQSKW